MIIKNGEILAIDHIAHDNTLSGNGTSAKPVGLSETYKSSVANQIKNVNDRITSVNSDLNTRIDKTNSEISNFESSAHGEIARIDRRIDDVSAVKVDKTTFTQYQTDVANSFTAVNKRISDVDAAKVDNTTFDNFKGSANGELTDIKQSITDLDNAKQAKGAYVSASDFNNLKSSAHDEIERIDGRIDTTNTNLTNNYYDKTTIDKKFADFGGYKFREPDPNNNNQPILNQGEEPDPKAIYLTQPDGASQYLQWIWDEEITEENKWKCIGDTTMDLSDYAKTVDVVASANANKTEVKNWADGKFETKQDFESVIAGYYTKGQVDAELENIAQEFVDTSAWANDKFATKTELANDKTELEGKINDLDTKVETELSAVSGKIIGELNSSEQALDERIDSVIVDLGNVSSTLENEITEVDNKVDTLTDELHDDYYTSNQIDAILAASGEYYTQSQVNEKLEEYAKSTDLDPIKDDIDSISAKFDELDRFVDDIDDDLDNVSDDVDTLSGKVNKLHNTVIESSNTVIATPTTGEDGIVIYELSANGNELWKPTVNADGDISWEKSVSTVAPTTVNIKGPKGEDGKTPQFQIDPATNYWEYSYDGTNWISLNVSATGPKGIDGTTPTIDIDPNDDTWIINGIDTGIVASGAVGPAGKDGVDGKNGTNGQDGISLSATSQELTNKTQVQIGQVNGPVQTTFDLPWGQDGISPTVTVTNIPADPSDPDHQNGGTEIIITDATTTNKFSAWNGNDGTMAGAPDIEGKNGISAVLAGSTYEVGLSGEFYKAVTSVSSKLDTSVAASTYATKDALDDYLTKNDATESYQPKGEYLSANALNGYATQSWVEDKHYLVANDIAGKADKTDLQYVSAGVDYVSGHIPTTVAQLTDSANYYTINQTSAASELSAEFLKYMQSILTGTGLTGDGATTALGIDAAAAINFTNASAKSAISATYAQKYYNSGSAFNIADIRTSADAAFSLANYIDEIISESPADLPREYPIYADYAMSAYIDANTISAMNDIVDELHEKLDSTDAAAIYQTKVDMSAYVAVTGDTMTGPLVVNATTNHPIVGISQRGDTDDFAVFGATRKKSNNNFGTTWLGVGSNGQGVLKNIPDTSTSASTEPAANGAYTQITFSQDSNAVPSVDINAKLNGSDHNYKSVVVSQQSYNSMSAFDATNGPNYMLRKLSNGSFDIGACVINVTSLPETTEANTYYFVYDP